MTSLLRIYSPDNLRALARDHSGTSTIENSLIAALVALAVISAVSEVGSQLVALFNNTAQTVECTVDDNGGSGKGGSGSGGCGSGGGSGSGGGGTGGSGSGSGSGKGGSGGGGAYSSSSS